MASLPRRRPSVLTAAPGGIELNAPRTQALGQGYRAPSDVILHTSEPIKMPPDGWRLSMRTPATIFMWRIERAVGRRRRISQCYVQQTSTAFHPAEAGRTTEW